MKRDPNQSEWKDIGMAVGACTAILVAGALVSLRSVMSNSSVALVLVLVVVAAASIGGRRAGMVTALAAGVAFDFFHTEPFNRLTINSADDVETVILLVLVGLAAGELVVRGEELRQRGATSHDELGRVHRVTEAAVEHPAEIIDVAIAELCDGLFLQRCWYEPGPPTVSRPEIGRRGTIHRTHYRLSGGEFELPDDELALPVRFGDRELGRFVLVPRPGVGVARDRRLAATSLADVVALSQAGHTSSTTP